MRISAFFYFLIATFISIGTQAVQRENAPFSITIDGPQKPVKIGSEVKVGIVLKNISDHEITVDKMNAGSQAEWHFLIEVHDDKGQAPPDTDYGRRIMGRETKKRVILYSSGDASFKLKPGETLDDEAIVNKLYDLSRPGKYSVQVSRKISDDQNKASIKSNTITVTVTK